MRNHLIQIFFAGFLCSISDSTNLCGQQALPAEAKKEINAYKKELKRINDLYQKAVIKARVDLDQKLSTLAKKYVDEDKPEKARLVEREKTLLQLNNSIERRLDLQKEIVGSVYKYEKRNWVMKFESDGFLYKPLENKMFPWVALTESEILYYNDIGELAVLRFTKDREKFRMKLFTPIKGVKGTDAVRIK